MRRAQRALAQLGLGGPLWRRDKVGGCCSSSGSEGAAVDASGMQAHASGARRAAPAQQGSYRAAGSLRFIDSSFLGGDRKPSSSTGPSQQQKPRSTRGGGYAPDRMERGAGRRSGSGAGPDPWPNAPRAQALAHDEALEQRGHVLLTRAITKAPTAHALLVLLRDQGSHALNPTNISAAVTTLVRLAGGRQQQQQQQRAGAQSSSMRGDAERPASTGGEAAGSSSRAGARSGLPRASSTPSWLDSGITGDSASSSASGSSSSASSASNSSASSSVSSDSVGSGDSSSSVGGLSLDPVPRTAAEVAAAAAAASAPGAAVLPLLARAASAQLLAFGPRQVSNVCWGVAKLVRTGIVSPQVANPVVALMIQHAASGACDLSESKPGELSSLAWAVTVLPRALATQPVMWQRLSEAAQHLGPRTFSDPELLNLLSALVLLRPTAADAFSVSDAAGPSGPHTPHQAPASRLFHDVADSMLQPAARVSAPELVPAAGESDGRAAAAAKAAAEAPREEAGAAPGPSQTRLAAMEPRLVLQLAGAVARAQRLGLYSAHPTFEAALVRACKAAFYHASSAQLCAFAHDVSGWWECSRSSSSSAAAGGTVPAAPSPVPAPPHHAASSHRSWRALVAASASRMCHRIALGKDTVEPRLVARLAAALLCGGSGGVSTAAAAAPAAAAGSGDAHQGCQQGERALFAGSGSLKQAERSEADALISVALPVLLRCGSRGGGGGGEDAATAAAALAEYVTAGGSRAGARALLSLYTRAQPHCVSLPPHLLARLILSLPAAAASPVWASLSHASAGTKSEAPVSGAGAVVGVSGGSGDGLGASPLAGGAGDGHVEPAQVLSSFGAAARAAAVPRLREFAPGERPAVLHALLAFAESLAGGRQGQGGDGEATGQAHAGEHSQARQASAV